MMLPTVGKTDLPILSLSFLIIQALLLSCDDGVDGHLLEGDPPETRGLWGAEPTGGAQEWRGVVGVGMEKYGMWCTGTLIDPQVVLTAGHCVAGESWNMTSFPQMLTVFAGPNADQHIASGAEIVPHPSWYGGLSTEAIDMALVKLAEPITDAPYYGLRDFPLPEKNDDGFLVGYGITESGSGGIQMMGDTSLLGVTIQELKTGGAGNAGICSGDSGGPVFTEQDGEWVVNAVNSYGTSADCDPSIGAYSVNTLYVCDWLNTTMMEFVGHDLGLEHCKACDATPVGGWGEGCGAGIGGCAEGLECMKPEGFSVDGGGFCGAPCCDFGANDALYCSDVAGGEELCGLVNNWGQSICVIHCEDDSDCLEGTVCKNKPFSDERICIAIGDGSGDTDSAEDTDSETTEDEDAGANTDADADTETTEETDADDDTDAGADGGTNDEESSTNGCGCRVVGNNASIYSPLSIPFRIW